MDPDEVRRKEIEGHVHLAFCMELYELQVNQGRFFLHEHPRTATSWQAPSVERVARLPGVSKVHAHMCPFDMRVLFEGSQKLVFKPTTWMSNSPCILKELNKQCTNTGDPLTDHKHADLKGGRAHYAQIYPEKLCLAILKGLRKELMANKHMILGSIGTTCEDPSERAYQDYLALLGAGGFIDDVTGQTLPPELVRAGRLDEKAGVLKHNVFTKGPTKQCFDRTGSPPIGTRWVETNKGDEDNPDVRWRWVATDFKKRDGRDDLFAATPPLETNKMSTSRCASHLGKETKHKFGFVNIR